jgi:hypothetical protein
MMGKFLLALGRKKNPKLLRARMAIKYSYSVM